MQGWLPVKVQCFEYSGTGRLVECIALSSGAARGKDRGAVAASHGWRWQSHLHHRLVACDPCLPLQFVCVHGSLYLSGEHLCAQHSQTQKTRTQPQRVQKGSQAQRRRTRAALPPRVCSRELCSCTCMPQHILILVLTAQSTGLKQRCTAKRTEQANITAAELVQASTIVPTRPRDTVYFLAGAGFFLRVVPSARESFDRIWPLGMALPLSYSWMTFGCSLIICAARQGAAQMSHRSRQPQRYSEKTILEQHQRPICQPEYGGMQVHPAACVC